MSNWILSSTILIAAVLILRRLFREKLSLRWQYALWGLVLLRLLVPFTFGSSPVSMERVTRQVVEYTTLAPAVREPAAVQPLPETAPAQPVAPAKPTAPAAPRVQPRLALPWWGLVWMGGSLLVAGLFLSTNARFSRKLRSATSIDVEGSPLPVYVAENIETPCLFGVMHPAVYLTPEVSDNPNTLRHALAHELTHYRHGDHIWSNLRCLCLVIHWFNPLVWLAARLSRQDAELACDEGTIRCLGEAERAAYGRTLIAMTCSKKSNPLSAATTMTASAKDVKERIMMIAKRPKNALTALLAVTLGAALLAGCSFLGSTNTGLGSSAQEVRVPLTQFSSADGSVQYRMQLLENLPQGNLPMAMLEPFDASPEAVLALAQNLVPEAQWTPVLGELTYAPDEAYDAALNYDPGSMSLRLTADTPEAAYTFTARRYPEGTHPTTLALGIHWKQSQEYREFTPEHQEHMGQVALDYLQRMELGQWDIVHEHVIAMGAHEQPELLELMAAPVIDGQPCYAFRPVESGALTDLNQQAQGPVAKILGSADGSSLELFIERPMTVRKVEKDVQTLPLESLLEQAEAILEAQTAADYLGRTMEDVEVEVTIDRLQYALVYTSAYGDDCYVPTLIFRGTFDVFDRASAVRYGSGSYDDMHFVLLTLDARDGQPLLHQYDWYNYLQMGGNPWADFPSPTEEG